MNKTHFLFKIEEICELPANTLKGEEDLVGSTLIDSLSLLGLIAMLDKNFGLNLTLSEMLSIGTVNNLYFKVSERVGTN
ncbi:MAG TPA: phosphopantetheine-binding protein [Patescibacteria group bacterium]|nr:phosphopantetheine-binding protein [Gammaproteobacteria bacterium]HWA51502.1 phosphopantetheine-binding protein [Patescibacteria group bacterium]